MERLYPFLSSQNFDQSITPPYFGAIFITGSIREVNTSGGMYPLLAAAGAAGNPRNIVPATNDAAH
jgi:hypothetical protein